LNNCVFKVYRSA